MAKVATPSLRPSDETVNRFRNSIKALPDVPVGIAVSGGPDSLALLLLAAAARPGQIHAATVDHALRPESRKEAEAVAAICGDLGVPHTILTAAWDEKPESAIQERARAERYRLLGDWTAERSVRVLATAHHLDDQAETVIMRLSRGAGVRGLSGMRRIRKRGSDLLLVRPLLDWRRSELEQICADAGLSPAADPSNEDEQFERIRIRRALAGADWLSAESIARSAANLAQADAALSWATDVEWKRAVKAAPNAIVYGLTDAPADIRRRVVRRSILRLASEGSGADLRGRELDRIVAILANGKKATLRGVLCSGGKKEWRFVPAPNRSRPVDKIR